MPPAAGGHDGGPGALWRLGRLGVDGDFSMPGARDEIDIDRDFSLHIMSAPAWSLTSLIS